MGSVWLATTESDLHPVAMKKVLQATARDTVRAGSMTGSAGRELRTRWPEAWDDPSSPGALAMPLQFLLTADATTRIHRYAHLETSGAKELVGTPVGQIVGRMSRVRPVRELVHEMMTEFVEAVARGDALLEEGRCPRPCASTCARSSPTSTRRVRRSRASPPA